MINKNTIKSAILCSILFVVLCACDNNINNNISSSSTTKQTTIDQIVVDKPESNFKEETNTAWKQAYYNYIESLDINEQYELSDNFTYCLIYIDDNDIPELFITTESEAGGEIVATYYNDKVVDYQLSRIGSVYIERSGLILTDTGHMDYYPVTITELKNGNFSEIANGLSYWSDEDKMNYKIGKIDEYILTYEWENQIVTQEDFEKSINQIFDTSKSKRPENECTLDEILNILSSTP